jgi:hypothetical protein
MNGIRERLVCVVSCLGIAILLFPLNEFYHAIQVGNFIFWRHVFRKTSCLSNGLAYEI